MTPPTPDSFLGVARVARDGYRVTCAMKTIILFAVGSALCAIPFANSQEAAPPTAPKWLLQAEDSLVGTWLNTNEATQSIPKVEIFRDGPALQIRFWGRTGSQDTPFSPVDALFVLSDYSERALHPPKPPTTIAFATHQAGFAIKHFTLRLTDDGLRIEAVTLFTDDSRRSNRTQVETYRKK